MGIVLARLARRALCALCYAVHIVIVKVWGSFLSLAVLWPGRLPFDPSLTTTGGLARGLLSLD